MKERKRNKVFERDGYECRNCGSEDGLIAHHIVPRLMGGQDKVSNLATLCEDCHEKVHTTKKIGSKELARRAINERLENGYDHGPPPFGMEYDADGHYQVPDPAVYPTVERIFALRDGGETLEAISDATGVPVSTTWKVLDRREWYLEREDMVGWGE